MDITLTFTTCKRLNLFRKTFESLKTFCKDFENISRILIVDDSSSDEDRMVMGTMAELICHNGKSHAKSLNLIRANVRTKYVCMFEDDWECTKEFKIQDVIDCLDDSIKYINMVCGNNPELTDKKLYGETIRRSTFDLSMLDNYVPPIYKDWVDSKNLRHTLEQLPPGNSHWPCYGLQPAVLEFDLIKYVEYDETETSSFMELEYGIKHVLLGNSKYLGSVNLGIKHIGEDSAYLLNGQRRWWDPTLPTIVTGMFDIGREDFGRSNDHYIKSINKILEIPNPKIIYTEKKFENLFLKKIENCKVIFIEPTFEFLDIIFDIVSKPEWHNQAEWIKNVGEQTENLSRYRAKYISTTFFKHDLLLTSSTENHFKTDEFYWVDSGIYSSFPNTPEPQSFKLLNSGTGKLRVSTYPYSTDTEIHGLAYKYIVKKIRGDYKNFVTRATIFGGNAEVISTTHSVLKCNIYDSLCSGCVGTEEAYYTIMCHNNPSLFDIITMPSGDIAGWFRVQS